MLEIAWSGLVCALWRVMPLGTLFIAPGFTLIGGGNGAMVAALMSTMTDVLPESERYVEAYESSLRRLN
jgi:hypothetical protein